MSAEATRKKILDATQRLIEGDGSTRLTTKEIALAAHCSEGTLFNHFKRKEDLLLAVVLENAPQFREEIGRLKAGQNKVRHNLEQIALASVSFFDRLIPLATSLFADIDILKRHRQAMAEEGRGPQDVFVIVATYIREEQQLGRINPRISPPSAAALLLGPCFHRTFIRAVMGGNMMNTTDRQFVKTLVATLVSGLGIP